MKNIFKPLLLVFFMGCTDILEQDNNNAISTGNFGNSVEEVKAAVNGAFHPITGTFFWGRIVHVGALLRSDEFNNFPNAENTTMSTFQGAVSGSRWAEEPYQELYKSISRCNNIILNTNPEGITDETVRNSLVGQAYFLRAFDYWYLVNLYGNVPLITTMPDLDNLFVSQVEPSKVWEQIIKDLEMAETMLPASWEGDDAGRPTSGAATALKGKSYLYMKEWEKAAAAFKTVIDSELYSLLPGSMYGDNFSTVNENNAESVFELQFLGQANFAWGNDIPGTGTMGNFHIEYAPPTKTPDKGHVINPWLKQLFEDNGDEIRRNETLVYDYAGATGYGGVDFATDFGDTVDSEGEAVAGDVSVAEAASVEAIFGKKYSGMDLGERSAVDFLGTNVGNNWRMIRYADVLLMYAEALNEGGNSADAVTYLNQVRERAGLAATTASGQDDVKTAIIEERAMELAGEGHRFFDLVRWGLADDYLGATSKHVTDGTQTYHPKSLSDNDDNRSQFTSGRDELVWIPKNQIDTNPNLKQNPGYN